MTPLTELDKVVHAFLYNRDLESQVGTRKTDARNILKDYLLSRDEDGRMRNGEADDKGNRTLYFEAPLTIGDTAYAGIQAQRRDPAPTIDLAAVEDLLRERGKDYSPSDDTLFYDKVFRRVVRREFDEDALLVLNQQGIVSDDELDALMVTGEPAYSLVAVKA